MNTTPPGVSLDPDPRSHNLSGSYDRLVEIAQSWEMDDDIPDSAAEMLKTSRELFIHSYFCYEFLVVATTWSLLAVETALRDALETPTGPDSPGLGKLINKASGRGWLTNSEAETLQAGKELRNRLVHATGQVRYTPGMAEGALETSHVVVANLYTRSAERS